MIEEKNDDKEQKVREPYVVLNDERYIGDSQGENAPKKQEGGGGDVVDTGAVR